MNKNYKFVEYKQRKILKPNLKKCVLWFLFSHTDKLNDDILQQKLGMQVQISVHTLSVYFYKFIRCGIDAHYKPSRELDCKVSCVSNTYHAGRSKTRRHEFSPTIFVSHGSGLNKKNIERSFVTAK